MYKLGNINSQYCQSLQEGARLVDMDIKHAWIYVGKLEDLAEVWERTISEQDSGQNGFIGLVMLSEPPCADNTLSVSSYSALCRFLCLGRLQ